ncbi:MAG: PDZ domain-containing protein, partial [Candidatus Palauibacterales bacterium]|nr:PDZ domain-containing protein [Candidatus Palauibacterales bacterium]
ATMEILELPSRRADRIRVLEGLELVTVTPEIADERSLRVDEGALIVGVDRQVSYRTGLQAGDVVVAVNRSRIRSAEQTAELFRYHAGRGQILVRAYRDGTLFTTSFFIRG